VHLFFWVIDGIAVGWLSQLTRYYRRNRITDFVMGVAGAVAGGFLVFVSPFFLHGEMIFSNLGAILGATVLIFLSRYCGASRDYEATTLQRTFRMNRSKLRRVAGFMPPRRVGYVRSGKEVL
jgi:uncharacterized membrane protein YeaQ/YmgE (transglycosylase-associated protein family)